ncbi:protein of unknown function (plasmid) [Caballeronia sp. S22]
MPGIGGWGEALGCRLTVVAVAGINHNRLTPSADFDNATSTVRHVRWTHCDHGSIP